MDLIQQLTEELKQQNAKADQLESNFTFRSVFSINGNPIMPPLMTPERRLEMQKLREAAAQIEEQLGDNSYSTNSSKCSTLRRCDGCCQLVDASTNTDAVAQLDRQLTTQPLIVMGRLKQTLEKTEPLIFDNNRNAIMKFIKPVELKWQLLLEQCLEVKQQSAVIVEQAAQFALSTAESETAADIEEQLLEEVVKQSTKEETNIKHTQRELRRFPTIPLIDTKPRREERLHPQLWKRHHSYPYSEPSDCAPPVSPCGDMSLPLMAPPADPNCKIQIKQRIAPEEEQSTPAGSKLKSKAANGSQQKLSSLKSSRKTPRVASGTAKNAAHATSHAKAEAAMSSTQRRLNYDPRATIKRAASVRKAATTEQQKQPTRNVAVAATAGGSNPELLKRKLLDEMEQQQRQRFHQLITEQAEEQQRMQQDFQSQQQLLMDQMISDMSSYACVKLEQPDSDSSSITSLPQSRLELDVDLKEK
ncbi:hypothetical protein KR044_006107 [Drosophila immigrans]|nr:hypothetical protein KR044_006107 [Drosophila immigrans]